MKLIGIHVSPFVRKVAAVLTLKGLDYEHEVVIPGAAPPEFLAISPLGKIPVLVDGDFSTPDSSVICEYLEELYPEPSLLPQTPRERARARFLEEYADTRLTEVMAVFVIENFVNPVLRRTQTDTARVQHALEEGVPPVLDYLETQVPGESFLFDALSIADLALASPVITAAYGEFKVDAGRWPRFHAFTERVAALPALEQVLAAELEVMATLAP